MVYSLLPNAKEFMAITFDEIEMLELYDMDELFTIETQPAEWLNRWKGMTLSFYDAFRGKKKKPTPDVFYFETRLFLTEKAKSILEPILSSIGEFLPAQCEGETVYIFNPLTSVKANPKMSTRNDNGVTSIVFDDEPHEIVFKTDFDDYQRVLCTEAFKAAVEENNLKGLVFQVDIANIVADDAGTTGTNGVRPYN